MNLSSINKFSDTDLVDFINDTIEYLKGEKIPFLSKYSESIGIGNVVPIREFII